MKKTLTTSPRYPIKSVGNALRLVLLLADRQVLGVSEAGAAVGVSVSTAHRLLGMLQHHGFAQRDAGTRAYVAGPALLRLTLSGAHQLELRRRAEPHLARLVGETGETAHLVVLEGRRVLFLDSVESSRALRVSSRTGSSIWAHCTSVGKALLAELSADRLADLYPDDRLPGLTAHSIVTRDRLVEELDAVRERGWAGNRGESEEGVGSVGVAIRDPLGRVVAAVSTAAPLGRLGKSRVDELALATRRGAAAIGRELGRPWVPGQDGGL